MFLLTRGMKVILNSSLISSYFCVYSCNEIPQMSFVPLCASFNMSLQCNKQHFLWKKRYLKTAWITADGEIRMKVKEMR